MRIPPWIRVVGSLAMVEVLSPAAFPVQAGQAGQSLEEGSKEQEPITCDSRAALRGRPSPVPRETGYAHVEVDLSRQQLLVVDVSGCVVNVLPVSSGSRRWFTSEGITRQAITPTGRFTVVRKITGWRESSLGMLYYPNYITESGIAIHGSSSVPSRPASHGCIRIPMSAAKAFSDVAPIGTVVLVY
jgi:lipoprotein-anchoring transpeptidase ErfK/SrfK